MIQKYTETYSIDPDSYMFRQCFQADIPCIRHPPAVGHMTGRPIRHLFMWRYYTCSVPEKCNNS